jgi:membrane fusion protein (multidrug efflux system)
MQSNFSPPASSISARVVLRDAAAPAQRAEGDPTPIVELPPAPPGRTLRERLRRPLLIGFFAVLAATGATYYLTEEPYVSTDDAFIRAAKESVNARVAGQVVEIAVKDNQQVRKGQLLFRLDPEPFQIAVDQAEARLGTARLQSAHSKPPTANNRRNSNRPRIPRTSTSVRTGARRRSPSPILRRARCMTGPKPI